MRSNVFEIGVQCFLSLLLVGVAVPVAEADQFWVYVGTYTKPGGSEGIYRFSFDADSGQAGEVKLVAKTQNPSFLALAPDGKRLYAVNETGTFQGQPGGGVTAYSINSQGDLQELNQQLSKGGAPCHIVVDATNKCVLVANYMGGNVACLPIQPNGLGPASSVVQHAGSSINKQRQEGPHAHSINISSDNRFAVAADLGIDKLLVYRFDPVKGQLAPNQPASASVSPGAGPRHFAFHPSGKFAYVINELALTVTAFDYNAERGTLKEIQTISTVPEGTEGSHLSTAEIRVHPSGKFVYGSNRGHDSIAVYKVNPQSGKLTLVEIEATGGKTPRNFFVDPTGDYLFAENQSSDTVVLFRIDPKTGELDRTDVSVSVPTPVCIRMLAR